MTELFHLGLRRAFRADHALVGGDWGRENQRHSHDYVWEIRLEGRVLDRHGFLVDLVTLEAAVRVVLARYRNAFLNDVEPFQGLNPSLERFARQLGLDLKRILNAPEIQLESVLWENQDAWASWSSS